MAFTEKKSLFNFETASNTFKKSIDPRRKTLKGSSLQKMINPYKKMNISKH
jgi:hypothetical protein